MVQVFLIPIRGTLVFCDDTRLDAKVGVVMDNHPDWIKSKKNGIRFGKQANTGYMRKKVDK
ncbi:hypothetical protein EGW24_03385 [Enterococcus faecium]|nr:hypothetical protein EGW24_03385 [Enterococcus faecium]